MSQTVAVEPRKEVSGLHRMTEKGLRDLCKKDKLYQTPRLNDVLYLHYQGYQYIECLDEYTELKCLWLECNAISEIEGLDKLGKLRCLFLQNNLIKRIDNLACCPQLDTLNLSSNHIRKIDNIGIDILPVLNTLNISSNYLRDSESLAHLINCKTLAVLDLSNNRIEDILVVKIFEQMPCLKVLVLQGNPIVSRLPQYRKTLILACKELTYLDSRPVFPRDRSCAEAWKRDGYEGERKENMRWNRADRKKMRDGVNYTIRLRNRHRPEDQQDALISSTDSEAEQEVDNRGERTRFRADTEYGCVDDIWKEVEEGEEDNDNSAAADSGGIPSTGLRSLKGRPKVLYEEQLSDRENIEEKIKLDKPMAKDEGELRDFQLQTIKELPTVPDESENMECKDSKPSVGRRVIIEEMPKDKPEIIETTNPNMQVNEQPLGEQSNKLEENIDKLSSNKLEPQKGKQILIEEVHLPKSDIPNLGVIIPTNSTTDDNLQSVEEGSNHELTKSNENSFNITTEEASKKQSLLEEAQQDSDSESLSAEDLEKSSQAMGAIVYDNPKYPTPEEIKEQCISKMYKTYGSEIYKEHSESIHSLLNSDTVSFQLDPKVCCEESLRPKYEGPDNFEACVLPKTKQQLDYEEECAEVNEKVEHYMEEVSNYWEEDLQDLKHPLEAPLKEENNVDAYSSDEDDDQKEMEDCDELTTVVRSVRVIEEFTIRRERISEEVKVRQKDLEKQLEELNLEVEETERLEKEIQLSQAENEDLMDQFDETFAKALEYASDDVPKRVFGAGHDTPSYKWEKEECMRQLTVATEVNAEEYQITPISDLTSTEQAERICEQMNQKLAADEAALRELLQELEDEADILYDIQSKWDDLDLTMAAEPPAFDVCVSLLDELIDQLQYEDVINGQNVKSFDFGLIESDEEYSYSAEPNVDKIVPAELEDPAGGKSLRECLDAFGSFLTTFNEGKDQRKVDRQQTTSSAKVLAAKELLKSRMVSEFNNESSEGDVDAQIAKQKEKVNRRANVIAARCYAKREDYEDSLEVVDNRLVIVKKHTGKIEELPPPPELISESESESETSGDEDDDDYGTADEDTSLANNETNDAPDQSMEEFYSLETQTTFNSLDSEFFDKLDLQKVIGTDGEITEEGMRSYNELKNSINSDFTKTDPDLVEKDEIIQNLIERKKVQDELEQQLEKLAKSQNYTPSVMTESGKKDNLGSTPSVMTESGKKDNLGSITLGNNQQETEQHKEGRITSDCSEILQDDTPNLQEFEKNEECQITEIRNPNESTEVNSKLSESNGLAPTKLTLGSAKLYEFKSKLPDNYDYNKEIADNQRDIIKSELEKLKTAFKNNENKSNADTAASNDDTLAEKIKSTDMDSIDDDIFSDASTDYESEDEIYVIEPPKFPQGTLNEYIANQFEDDLKLERECEDLRKELYSLPLRDWTNQVPKDDNYEEKQDEESDDTTDVDETTDVETESDTTIQQYDDDVESNNVEQGIIEIAVVEKELDPMISAVDNTNIVQVQVNEGDQSASNSDSEINDASGKVAQTAKQQWDEIVNQLNEFIDADDMKLLSEKQFADSDSNDEDLSQDLKDLKELTDVYKQPISNYANQQEQVFTDQINLPEKELIGDQNAEQSKDDEGKDENEMESKTFGKESELLENLTTSKTHSIPPIKLDYFESNDPDDADEPDFYNASKLQTEEIECNLEILGEDGETLVNEVSVNAQLTYEFK